MKFTVHTAFGCDDVTTAPARLNTHETAREFIDTLTDLFGTEPVRIVHDEYRTPAYVWTNVTVALPGIGEVVFSVDSRAQGPAALRLYLNQQRVEINWTEGKGAGRILAEAVPPAVRAREAQAARWS